MLNRNAYREVAARISKALSATIPDVQVEIGDNLHYPGTNIVITSSRFQGLLPEQRFHHVVRGIPPDIYEQHLRAGLVWFELAPGESAHDYMKMPRTEDVAKDAKRIDTLLRRRGFFSLLPDALSASREPASMFDFPVTRSVLRQAAVSDADATRVCLHLMRLGAFCDAHVAQDLLPRLAGENAA